MTSPTIDFRSIRGNGPLGSQADGFEELVCQLAPTRLLDVPAGSRTTRFGNPDGGREMRIELPGGDVWAVQAKYLFTLTAKEIGQVEESVERVLGAEPRLTRYLVVLPCDRPGGDTLTKRSAWTRWRAAVDRWEALAQDKGMSVSFEYAGLHQLTSALMNPAEEGRLRYWFDAHVIDAASQRRMVEHAVAGAGPRYSPEVHIELPVAAALDALGHTDAYATVVRRMLAALRAARQYPWRSPEEHAEDFAPLLSRASSALDDLDVTLTEVISAISGAPAPLPEVDTMLDQAGRAVNAVQNLLHDRCLTRDGHYVGDAATLSTKLSRAVAMLYDLSELLDGPAWAASHKRVLLLIGEGGTGKTHLLCDTAQRRAAAGAPTLIALGQQFDDRRPSIQLVELANFDGTSDEMCATLNVAAESAGQRAVIMIDAVNESQTPRTWRNYLAELVVEVLRHPWLSLVVSCRTPYVDYIIPEGVRQRSAIVEHCGFQETASTALARYLEHHGLEAPSFPVLSPELTNPLFLRLVCEVARDRGLAALPRDGLGLDAVFGGYLDAVDKRLADASRCDYDPTDRLVRRAVRSLASVVEHGAVSKERVRQVTNNLLPGRDWSRSLHKGLLDEGVLLHDVFGHHERVRFGYERLGDLAAASLICERPPEEVADLVRGLSHAWYSNAGVLQALSVLLPETHGVEVVDVVSEDGRVDGWVVDALLDSLPLRRASSVSERTVELVDQLVDGEDPWDGAYPALLDVAATPGHALNADWLHRHLFALGIVERDLTWTVMCNDGRAPALDVLVDWAWGEASIRADDEVARLAATTLGWCLASSNRRLRDRSTKALVHLLQRRPAVLVRVLADFDGVDDPYVQERLLAVAAGVTARCPSIEARQFVGRAVARMTTATGRWPQHLLTRDYARRSIEAAVSAGWDAPTDLRALVTPPYGTTWPVPTRTEEEIEVLGAPPEYRYSSITRSVMSDLGDFGKYVARHSLSEFASVVDDQGTVEVARRRIVDRVLELGWDPDRHGVYDKARSWKPQDPDPTERLGKKYQWIALHEMLGAVADNFSVGGRWGNGERPYDDPSDIGARDIDPTVVSVAGGASFYEDFPRSWVNPALVDFTASDLTAWLASTADLPDPTQFLRFVSPEGVLWSIAEGHYQWTEQRKPEEELLVDYRMLWCQVRAYIFDVEHRDAVTAWAADQDFSGRWMPEASQNSGVLLADHPHHRTWRFTSGDEEIFGRRVAPPTVLTPASASYTSGSDYDRSTPAPARGLVPSAALHRLLGISGADDFCWSDADGPVAQDPSTRAPLPISLLMRHDALVNACAANGKSVLWTVTGEKQLMDARHHFDFTDGQLIGMAFQASYVLDGEKIRFIGGTTAPCHVLDDNPPFSPWSPSN